MIRTLALALAIVSAACAGGLKPAAPQGPGDAVREFIAAFNQLDAARLRPLFAEEATAFLPMPQHAELARGRETILGILGPLLEADRQRRNGQPLTLEAKDLAVQEHGAFAVAMFDVGTADVHSRRTLVLQRRAGRWLIIHLHASNVRP
jgi:ketosteroid isomerase-like protein